MTDSDAGDGAATCGAGVAQQAAMVAAVGVMFEGLAETFSLHRGMLQGDSPATRQEDAVYQELALRLTRISTGVREAAAFMEAQRTLPMADHDEEAWGEAHVRAFEKFVSAQTRLLGLLRVAVPREERMLASMKEPGQA
ncbi:MAG: hypothetical protein ABW221_04170 [Vicinamibacteria bacterium]